MVVLMAVGLQANALVHSCIVCCSICLMVALAGTDAKGSGSFPRMCMSASTGPDTSCTANRDSGPALLCVTACIPACKLPVGLGFLFVCCVNSLPANALSQDALKLFVLATDELQLACHCWYFAEVGNLTHMTH